MCSKTIEDFVYAAIPGQDNDSVKLVERERLRDFLRVSPAGGNCIVSQRFLEATRKSTATRTSHVHMTPGGAEYGLNPLAEVFCALALEGRFSISRWCGEGVFAWDTHRSALRVDDYLEPSARHEAWESEIGRTGA